MLQLTISFEDAYHGIEKEVSYQHQVMAKDLTTKSCETCSGRGVVMQQARTVFGVMQTQAACPTCGGAGSEYYRDGNKVHSALEQESQTIKVKIPAGIKSESKIRYQGMGNA